MTEPSSPPYTVTAGTGDVPGASPDATGVTFAVHAPDADAIAICLFDAADTEIARVRLPGRTGGIVHGHIAGIGPGARYGLRAFGPWAPDRGQRFNPARLLLDPYATAIDRPLRLGPLLFEGNQPNPTDTAAVMPKAVIQAGAATWTPRPAFAWHRQVIYELHVRGFTKSHPAIPPDQRGTFAGLAHPAAIAHLTRLGVTTVELLPVAAWIDDRHLLPLGLSNYWGYNPVALAAPDPRLAPGGWPEVRQAVAALQAAGIAVILDVVLNHTGEGDELGPTLSLRGLANPDYYRLRPGDPARYVNDAGCGNTLRLEHPAGLHLAMTALRTWATRAGVDGFRLDLATTLARRPDGFDPAAPILAAIEQDPVLSRLAFIAEPWDVGPGGYQLGAFPTRWGEWNDRYRDAVRRFWRGDGGMLGELATRLAGSADVFAGRRRPLTRSINFVTAHDGFTLADLVAYAGKHNVANGEANADGTDANTSWNNGTEGPTEDPAIRSARARDVRAVLATLLLSRGTPMLSMGDEAGRTQGGNNNAYAQDNAISWFDWDNADDDLTAFTAELLAIRRDFAALFGPEPLTGRGRDDSQIADVSWHRVDGAPLTGDDWHSPDRRTLVFSLYADGQRGLTILHADADAITVNPPAPRHGYRWRCVLDTSRQHDGSASLSFHVGPRSVLWLTEEPDPVPRRPTGVSTEALERLAGAAGIAPVWWDINGNEHLVTDDTKRTLLAAMRLPATTLSDLTDSEARLRAIRAPAGLPASMVVREGETIRLRLPPRRRGRWLNLVREDGSTARIVLSSDTGGDATLPPLPIGRHLVMSDNDAAACHLTVVPARCYLPPALAAGERRFGVAAHLYAVRGARDHGIGDFSTLAELARAAAGYGASVVGLNPLHALFPGNRERASPYHPSDRRFLDPIYIDVTALAGDAPALPPGPSAVDYPFVWEGKQRILRAAFDAGGVSDPGLAGFIAASGDTLRDFAIFQAIAADLRSTHWQIWPEGLRRPDAAGVAAFAAAHAREIAFTGYQQYLADLQLAGAAAAGRDAGLAFGFYRDLAVGAAPDGAEAWSRQGALLTGVSVGAPPDPFSANGQVWSLPPPDPHAMTQEAYAGFADLLAANMRHAGALRIDHAMGLQRLFVVPDGASAKDGAYLHYPLDDLMGMVALESQRAKCVVVGEDLGTVLPGFRERLGDADVLSYSVLWFEREGAGFCPPSRWRPHAAACISTHDLPTLVGWWDGADIAERHTLGLLPDNATDAAWEDRRRDKAHLIAALRDEGLGEALPDPDQPMTAAFAAAVHAFIGATPALLALVQLDDMAGEPIAVNLPGTDRERPNWRRRLTLDVDAAFRTDIAAQVKTALAARAFPPAQGS